MNESGGPPSTQRRVVHASGGVLNRLTTIVLLCALGLSFLTATLSPETTLMDTSLGLVLLGLAVALHVVVHEAAHSVAALALGMGVPEVQLGQGTPLLRFRLGSTVVKLGGFHSGATHLQPRSTALLRTRLTLVSAAGPLSNLTLAAAAYWVFEPRAGSFSSSLVLSGLVLGLFNLAPLKVRTPTGTAETDGRSILHLLLTGRREAEQIVAASRLDVVHRRHVAGESVQREVPSAPLDLTDPVVLGIEGTRRIFTGEHDEAIALLRQAVAKRQKDDTRASSLNNLAWALVLARPDGWLEEAERASREAIELCPGVEAMKSTRGCILVHRGELDEARPLLKAALTSEVAPQDQLFLYGHLLRAELGLGNLYGAREALLRMVDVGGESKEIENHRRLLRSAEVDHALTHLVGSDGLIQWPDAQGGGAMARHVREMKAALVAFLDEAGTDHRREPLRLALGG